MKCKLSVIFSSKFCTYRGEKEMALNLLRKVNNYFSLFYFRDPNIVKKNLDVIDFVKESMHA